MLKFKKIVLLCGLLFAIGVLIIHIKKDTEEFTPGMRVAYRPYIRNVVILYDTYFNYYISKKYRLI